MLRLAFDFIITWRETRTRPNAYKFKAYNFLKSSLISEAKTHLHPNCCKAR